MTDDVTDYLLTVKAQGDDVHQVHFRYDKLYGF
jgi:hypothetical protein